MEIWKDILGYEGKYKISSHGNVWSKTKGILNNNPRGAGYINVGLWKNNTRVSVRVHRLVASHFIDNPNGLPLVDHINNIRHDNCVTNLRWVDYRGNSLNMKKNTVYSVKDYIEYTEEELQNEVWVDATKIIEELHGKDYFMVSNLGRYRYFKKNNRWNTKSLRTVSPKYSFTYPKLSVKNNGKNQHFSVHKIVALCFLGKPKEGEVIDHIDSDINNPRLNNLQIISTQENNKKANKQDDKGSNNGMSKLFEDDVNKILNMFFFEQKSKGEIRRFFNININTVTRIVSGETYKKVYEEFCLKNSPLPITLTPYEQHSKARKGITQKKLTCPHCNKIGGNANMVRYHFENCKSK